MIPANVRIHSAMAADDAAFDITQSAFVEALERAEDSHFWYVARNRYILRRLRQLGVTRAARFTELGCGGGVVAAALAREGFRVTGVDGHYSRLALAASRATSAQFILADLRQGLSELEADQDGVGFFDVLEHLQNPQQALIDASRLLKTNGVLVGTVPALMGLWSAVDARAGHKLRYNRPALLQLFGNLPDLKIVEARYFNRSLVPIMALRRRRISNPDRAQLEDLQTPNILLNAILSRWLSVENVISPFFDLARLPGASLWFALRKTVGETSPDDSIQ